MWFFLDGEDSLLDVILTISLEILKCQECSNESESIAISTIDILVGGNHCRGKFRSDCKFMLRDMNI